MVEPNFSTMGTVHPIFDRLVSLMVKKPDLLDKIIIVKEGLDLVKYLFGFFNGKLTIIQSKMKILTNGFYSLILSIVDSRNKIKDWVEWSNYFDDIVNFPFVMPIFDG